MKKRVVSSFIGVVLILCMSFSASAGVIVPFWDNAQTIALNLAFSGSGATGSAVINGKAGTTKITATLTLEKLVGTKYVFVDSWSGSSSSSTLAFSGTASGITSGTYRLTCVSNVTRNGSVETITNSISRVK